MTSRSGDTGALVNATVLPRGSQTRFALGLATWVMLRTRRMAVIFLVFALVAIGYTINAVARGRPWWWLSLTSFLVVSLGLYAAAFVCGPMKARRLGLFRAGQEVRLTIDGERLLISIGEAFKVIHLRDTESIEVGFRLVRLGLGFSATAMVLPRSVVTPRMLDAMQHLIGETENTREDSRS